MPVRAPKPEVVAVQRDQLSLAGLQSPRSPRAWRRFPGQVENADDESNFEEPDFDDDSELDPIGEPWDPSALEDDDEEPEPEYGDFWPEPDDFDD
jgi:hypothetical protein